jgi:anti-sigma regulatory factor (Ser/Thr protein kinase)
MAAITNTAGGSRKGIHGLLLAASYPTSTAWEQPVAQTFADNITSLCRQDEEFRLALWLSVHEAVVNAVVHGNLEIQSPEDSSESMTSFHQKIRENLNNPEMSARRVALVAYRYEDDCIRIEITDQGPGLPEVAIHKNRQASGMGCRLMQSLALHSFYDHERRTQILDFVLKVPLSSGETLPA